MTKFCGPKCSACCGFISLWGVIMLGLMGLFFYIQCPALSSDIPINQNTFAQQNYNYTYIEELYQQNAINCWITALIFLAFFIFCTIMFYINIKEIQAKNKLE